MGNDTSTPVVLPVTEVFAVNSIIELPLLTVLMVSDATFRINCLVLVLIQFKPEECYDSESSMSIFTVVLPYRRE